MCGARVVKCMPDGEAVQVVAGDTEAANDINSLVTNACTPALMLGALEADARQRVGLCDCALMVEAVLSAVCIEPFPGDVVLAPDTPAALVYAAATVVNVTLADGIVEIDEARIEQLRAEIAQHVHADLAAVLDVVRPYHVARATRPVGMLHLHDARSRTSARRAFVRSCAPDARMARAQRRSSSRSTPPTSCTRACCR
jgi:hypothetical protein